MKGILIEADTFELGDVSLTIASVHPVEVMDGVVVPLCGCSGMSQEERADRARWEQKRNRR